MSTCATGYTKVGYDENGCTALGVSLLMNGLNSSMCPFLTYLTDDMRSANLLSHDHCSNHVSMARFWWRLQWAMVSISLQQPWAPLVRRFWKISCTMLPEPRNCTVHFLSLVTIPITNLNIAMLVKCSCLALAGEAFPASLEQADVVGEAKPSVAKLAHLLTSLMAVTGQPPGTLILLLRMQPIYTRSLTSDSGKSCLASEQKIAHMYDRWGIATVFCNGNSYCCPGDEESPFEDCHWVGQGDCAQNTCADTEITLLTDNRGDSYTGCSCEFSPINYNGS